MRLEHEHVLWLLGSLCGLNRIPFDPKLILQNFPPPHSEAVLFAAAKGLGFRLGSARLDAQMLRKLPAACIAFLRQDGGTSAEQGQVRAARMALLLRADDERVLYFQVGNTRPQSIALTEAELMFETSC